MKLLPTICNVFLQQVKQRLARHNVQRGQQIVLAKVAQSIG